MMSFDDNELLIHCAYHKVATTYFHKILQAWGRHLSRPLKAYAKAPNLDTGVGFIIDNHSRIDPAVIQVPYRMTHMVRDPRDMVVSGYFYHCWCDERWCNYPDPRCGGLTYKELLNSVPESDGIALEICRFRAAFRRMQKWNYGNEQCLELRFEDLAKDELAVIARVLEHYGFDAAVSAQLLSLAEDLSFKRRTEGREKGTEDRKSHFRKGVAGEWREIFKDHHKTLFKMLYPKLLVRLGYESDSSW